MVNTNDFITNEELASISPPPDDYRISGTDNDPLSALLAQCIHAPSLVMVSDPGKGGGSGGGASKQYSILYSIDEKVNPHGIHGTIVTPNQLRPLMEGQNVGTKFLPEKWGILPRISQIGREAFVTAGFLKHAYFGLNANQTQLAVTEKFSFPFAGQVWAYTAVYDVTHENTLFCKLTFHHAVDGKRRVYIR